MLAQLTISTTLPESQHQLVLISQSKTLPDGMQQATCSPPC